MAHFAHLKEAGSINPAVSFFHDVGISLVAAVNAIVNRYQAANSLARFDDRMLADIGLTPGDVDSAFAGPIWQDPTRRLAVIAVERRSAARWARLNRVKQKEADIELLTN